MLAACLALAATALASAGTQRSTRFAGYWSQVSVAGRVSDTGQIVVPRLKCTAANRAIAVSVGLYTTDHRPSAANLILRCFKGKPSYFPELVVNGSNRNYFKFEARPGDKVVLHISAGPQRTLVSVDDKTLRFKRSVGGRGSSHVSDPWVGDVGWSNAHKKLEGVPDFGKLRFSDSMLNDEPFGSAKALQRFNRVTAPGTGRVQIETGPFSDFGESFKTVFEHS